MTLQYGILPNKNYFLQDSNDYEDEVESSEEDNEDFFSWVFDCEIVYSGQTVVERELWMMVNCKTPLHHVRFPSIRWPLLICKTPESGVHYRQNCALHCLRKPITLPVAL